MTLAFQLPLFTPTDRWKQHLAYPPREMPDYVDPFLAHHAPTLAKAGEGRMRFNEDDWNHEARGAVGVDVESYRNLFVVCVKRFADGRRLAFERSERADLDTDLLAEILRNNTIITFNGIHYDLPMIWAALAGTDTLNLKATSDRIIFDGLKPWEMEEKLGVRALFRVDHIDLMEPNPAVRQGLKILQGRLHCRFMVDLPYPPEATLTPEQMNVVTLYCNNDIDGTETVYGAVRDPLKMRVALRKIYGTEDLRSKSDSQVGEAIVKRRVEVATGRNIGREVKAPTTFGYAAPDFLRYDDPALVGVLDRLRTATFIVSGGKPVPPEWLRNLSVKVGRSAYTMGIGGLHSTEAHRALVSDDGSFLLDVDVASQYPNIITRLGIYPRALGPKFLGIYSGLIRERLAAKAAGDRVRMDGGRVALNGVFGKLGSQYSCLYSPDLLIAVTLTGQLTILMLIEAAERAGVPVVSANTDGVVFHCPRASQSDLDKIISDWEASTGMTVERTPYRAIYNSSVNTYIAIREDGKVKRKGAIADPWAENDLRSMMMKNPQMTVCSSALVRYLTDGVPVEETIEGCADPRAFVTVIKVNNGASWRGHLLGRAVRYYWSTDGEQITRTDNGGRVPKTEGARPLQELTDEMPPDVDYLRYFAEAYRLAEDMGVMI